MALLGRLFVIAIGFLFAAIAAGLVVVGMLLFPELSQIVDGPIDHDALNIVMGFGFIFVSGFALLPALVVVLITETFSIRSALAYAIGGGLVGVACYLGLVPFDPGTLHFDGIIRRHLEIMAGAGIVGGMVYWLIAGRNAGGWRAAPRLPRAVPQPAVRPQPAASPPARPPVEGDGR